MGLFDDFFDTKIFDDSSKIKYTPMKFNSIKLKDYVKQDWCISLKGTDIFNKCLNDIMVKLPERTGVGCDKIPETIGLSWADNYWCNDKNYKHYTNKQLKLIGKESENGKSSNDLCYEMLEYVWFTIIPLSWIDKELDDDMILKLYNKYEVM